MIALGGLLAGGGTLLGTGAFSTVTAERSVSLQAAGDANAFLGLEILDDAYVEQTDGTIGFDILAESTTTFADLVNVRNNGTQAVTSLRFAFDVTDADQPDDAVETALKIVSGDASIDAVDEVNLLTESDAGGAADDVLTPGEAVPFGIAVDLIDADLEEVTGDPEITLTIIADTGGTSGDDEQSGSEGPAPTLEYYGGPSRESNNGINFQINNTGGSVTITGFALKFNTPGSSPSPANFDGFEIDITSELIDESQSGDELKVEQTVNHTPYSLPADGQAAYQIAALDRNPSQNSELVLTIFSDEVGAIEFAATEFNSPGNN